MKIRQCLCVAAATLFLFISVRLSADETAPAVSSDTAAVKPTASEEIPSGSIEVVQLVFCSSLQDRDPGPEITTAKVGDVVIGWTKIRSGLGDVTVTHRWLHGNDEMGDAVMLQVKGSPWRTWSRKTLSEAGDWKLQVLDPQGKVLKESTITVAEASAAPTPPAAQ